MVNYTMDLDYVLILDDAFPSPAISHVVDSIKAEGE